MITVLLPRPDGDLLRLVTQPDHAHFAAEALALFRVPELAAHPRRNALLRAVRLHDNGWRELDAAPPVDPGSGLPYGFIELPLRPRLEAWERGTARYADSDPYVALLATQHALALHADRREEEGWRELLPQLEERRADLLARCDLSEAALAADYRWLELADALSLAACGGWTRPVHRLGYTFRRVAQTSDGEHLELSPFPLAGQTTLTVPSRVVAARRYRGDAVLGAALAEASWRSFPVRLAPA
jgi:hypothetical protein